MPERQAFKINPLTAILLVVIIAVPLVLILREEIIEPPTPQTDITQDESLDLIPVESTDKIVFGNLDVMLPDGWVNKSRHVSPRATNYECLNASTCQFGVVSSFDGQIDGATVSFQSVAREKSPIYSEPSKQKFKIFGKDVELTVEKAVVLVGADLSESEDSDSGEEEVSNLIVQIFGCAEENICVSSGMLRTDTQENNDSDVAKFRDMLAKLKYISD